MIVPEVAEDQENIVACEVKFEGEHLKSLSDASLGHVVKEAMGKAEEFIQRKLGQINAARN